MDGLDLFDLEVWKPFAFLGLDHPLLEFQFKPIMHTWVALLIIVALTVVVRFALKKPDSVVGYLVCTYVRFFMDMVTEALGAFDARICYFVASLFTFILISNWLVLIPGMEEPTNNLNTTLALGILSFLYSQREALKTHGLRAYLNEYFKTPLAIAPHGIHRVWDVLLALIISAINMVIAIAFLPLELLSKFASVVSISFRLFGNIFGGSIIHGLWMKLLSSSVIAQFFGIITGINLVILLFFGVFEGAIQAFVFSILTLTYISMARGSSSEDTHAPAECTHPLHGRNS